MQSNFRQESVWDYPLPPRVEDSPRHIEIYFHGDKIVDSKSSRRVLEKGAAPVYYIPPDDIKMEYLQKTDQTSICPYKGEAIYYTVVVGSNKAENAA